MRPIFPTGEAFALHCVSEDHGVDDFIVTPEFIPDEADVLMVLVRFHVRCKKHPDQRVEIDWQ